MHLRRKRHHEWKARLRSQGVGVVIVSSHWQGELESKVSPANLERLHWDPMYN
jgi:hypothetical protein